MIKMNLRLLILVGSTSEGKETPPLGMNQEIEENKLGDSMARNNAKGITEGFNNLFILTSSPPNCISTYEADLLVCSNLSN